MTVDLDETIIPDELADFVGKKYRGKFVEENYHGSWGMACRFFNSQPSTKAKEVVRSTRVLTKNNAGNNE
jgi:hypothetical protein